MKVATMVFYYLEEKPVQFQNLFLLMKVATVQNKLDGMLLKRLFQNLFLLMKVATFGNIRRFVHQYPKRFQNLFLLMKVATEGRTKVELRQNWIRFRTFSF